MAYKSTSLSGYAVISSFLLSILGEKSWLIHKRFESSIGKSTIHDAACYNLYQHLF